MKNLSIASLTGIGALANVAVSKCPKTPVQLVIPWPSNDSGDVLTRLITDKLQETYCVPRTVMRKLGDSGGSFPTAIAVVLAPADGCTVGSVVPDVPLVGPTIGSKSLTPKPFEPIGFFPTYPIIFAAAGDTPYFIMAELATTSRLKPVVVAHFVDRALPRRHFKAVGSKIKSVTAFDTINRNKLASGGAGILLTSLGLMKPCVDDLNVLAAQASDQTECDVAAVGKPSALDSDRPICAPITCRRAFFDPQLTTSAQT